ncbi:porin OmpA [Gallibacterium salpingitidis]|uniref:Outer membrane protein A n=1 Tax=Gallibacterium salpingitidis TaxID=505341 RepID=A0A1A7P1T3_9PAST|nr:porin OmpA [Gallibacterium salpingitidis]OBW95790.1 membrane protein [Gallibacterium salpingitidis]
MKKTAIALAISGLAFVSVAQAAPQANTFYAGAKAGWASFHNDVNQFDKEYGGTDAVHRNSETYGVFGGYQITDNFAVEAGYDFYGKLRMHDGDSERSRHTAHGLNLSLKASYPVAYVDGLDVYGRLGAALIRSDYTQHDDGVKTASEHKLKVSPVFAAGVEYAILPELAARLEYQWVAKVGKVSQFNDDVSYSPSIGSVSLGLSYRFGQGEQAPAPAVEVVNKKFALSSDVLFAFGKANLKPEAAQSLDNLQQEISKVGNLSSVEVAGYTDRIGSDKYNLKLSQDRANTVANYLVSKSVSPDVIKAVGYGEANPVTGNTCDAVKGRKALIACLAPDRRVEVSVSGQHQTTVEK